MNSTFHERNSVGNEHHKHSILEDPLMLPQEIK